MHVSELILLESLEGKVVLGAGMVLTAAGTAVGLRKLDYERMPQVAVLSSAFFVVSLIQVPGFSVHLVLNGLVGLILGWAAFPAMLIAVILHSVIMGPGTAGLTAVGINTLIMALPAIVCYYALNRAVRSSSRRLTFLAGFAAGAMGVILGIVLVAGALAVAGKEFVLLGGVYIGGHLLVALIEGLVTGSAVVFLRKVRPELLEAPLLLADREEVTHG